MLLCINRVKIAVLLILCFVAGNVFLVHTQEILQSGDSDSALLSSNSSDYININIERIQKRGFLVVGLTAVDQYPFYFSDEQNQLKGLDIDIAKEIAKTLEVNVLFNRDAQTFNDLIPLVENRVIDLAISKLSKTISRAKRVLYSDAYLVFRQAMLVNRLSLARISNNDEKTRNFIKNYNATLGVIENSSYERFAAINFPNAQIIKYDSWTDAVEAVEENKVFGIYRDELEILKIIINDPEINLLLKPLLITDQLDPIAIAIHKNEPHFVSFVNIVLANFNIPENIEMLITQYKD